MSARLRDSQGQPGTWSFATTFTACRTLRSPLLTGSRRKLYRCESAGAERCFARCSTRTRTPRGAKRACGARLAALRRLQMRRDEDAVLFRCIGCSPASASYDLGNPSFARLVGDLVRPAAILNRAAVWSGEYFRWGAGEASCTRCGGSIHLRHHREGSRRGLHGVCRACSEQVWSSVLGLAHSRPEARAFRAKHARVRTLPERDLAYGTAEATLVRLEAVRGSAALDGRDGRRNARNPGIRQTHLEVEFRQRRAKPHRSRRRRPCPECRSLRRPKVHPPLPQGGLFTTVARH